METPELFSSDNNNNNNNFLVDDLLDFPNDDIEAAMTGLSTDSCNSSSADPLPPPPPASHFHPAPPPFSNDLSVPYEELAELEWLSNFAVEESFSTEDQQKLQLIQGMKARPNYNPQQSSSHSQTHLYQFQPDPVRPPPVFHSDMPVPAKARSKRSRAPPGNWTSRLLAVSPNPSSAAAAAAAAATPLAAISSTTSESEVGGKKPVKAAGQKVKKDTTPENSSGGSGEGRKCLHCATDKTPQWRTGPMGPKTLCNACGVRYKSGRLVPEYRPAASPTFVLTKHSNSHRKVLELRRQKEMMLAQQQNHHHHHHHHQFLQHHHHHHHQSMMFDVPSTNGVDDYLIHQHIGPDFRQLI